MGLKLIWKFSGEVRIYLIEYLLYGEVEREGTVSTPIDGSTKGELSAAARKAAGKRQEKVSFGED